MGAFSEPWRQKLYTEDTGDVHFSPGTQPVPGDHIEKELRKKKMLLSPSSSL